MMSATKAKEHEQQDTDSARVVPLLTPFSEELRKTLERRRDNLNRLLNYRYAGRTKDLAREVRRSVPYLQKILRASHHEAKPIGEGVARDIEMKLGLEHLWLDREHTLDDTGAQRERRLLPVVGTLQRGKLMPLEKAVNFVLTMSADPQAYVLRSTDDSYFPRLWRDEGVVIEPSSPPHIDSMILVKHNGSGRLELFRLLAEGTDSITVGIVVCLTEEQCAEITLDKINIEYLYATNGIVDCRRTQRRDPG